MSTTLPGPLLARGNTSDVHEWSPGSVVKLLRPEIPEQWADTEARKLEAVAELDLPAPAILDRVAIDGRPGIVMDRIDGPSMWSVMCDDNAQIPSLTRTLIDIQTRICAAPAPRSFPSIAQRLAEGIERNRLITDDERTELLAELEGLDRGASLCHFDIHPMNVLLSADGPVVIDWFDAASGSLLADVARSDVLMDPVSSPSHLAGPPTNTLVDVHTQYVSLAASRLGGRDLVHRWRRVILAGRMVEPLPSGEVSALLALLRDDQGQQRSGS